MIEEKLIEKGISQEKLDEFARKRVHNGKEDVFRNLTSAESLDNLKKYSEGNFLFGLGTVLEEEGIKRNYSRKAFQIMANEMLRTLKNNCDGKYENVGLNKIYNDTIKRLDE